MLRHDALFYGSDDEFAEPISAFLSEGIEAGEPAVVVATASNSKLLASSLGPTAEHVTFIDSREWYHRPGPTIDGYRRVLDDLTSSGAPMVRVVGQVEFGRRRSDHLSWTRYESVLNKVFEASPAWIVCPYDTNALPDEVLDHAQATHPQLWESKRRRPSPRYTEPSTLLNKLPEAFAKPKIPPLLQVPVNQELNGIRLLVQRSARLAGLPEERTQDLILAVNEVVTNVIRHAGGEGRLTLWDTGPTLICEIQDRGPGLSDPFAGYIPPPGESVGGMGIWIARQMMDRVAIEAVSGGTKVQLTLYK